MKKLRLMIGISMALLAVGVSAENSTAQARQGHQEQPVQTASSGKPISGRYLDNGDGTITDTKTQLTWKKCSEGQSGDHCSGKAIEYTWDDAMAKFGKGEWRLPTIQELHTLTYCSNGTTQEVAWYETCGGKDNKSGEYQRPTIDLQAFPSVAQSAVFWSASPFAFFGDSGAWAVYFESAHLDGVAKVSEFQVRLVSPPISSASQSMEPEMINIPAGTFMMGCKEGRDDVSGGCKSDEKPAHEVAIKAFQLATTPVTFEQWDACEAAKACPHAADDEAWGRRGSRPVINVSWNDAQIYLQWLNKESGKNYRLPTEAEWEYAARAGTSTAYWWGSKASHAFANYGKDECCDGFASGKDQWVNTSPIRNFAANPFGLYDMNGNVYQWVEDCYIDSYEDAPADGTARQDCSADSKRVLRGGGWNIDPQGLRSASRFNFSPRLSFLPYGFFSPLNHGDSLGFRVARTL